MSVMDLRHARTFVTVAELGTVSKAAVRLRIAQPALSRQIGSLEQELGLKLFDRVGRRLVLTGEGEQLLGDCRGLLSLASAIAERAQLLGRGDTGTLRVAASPQFIEGALSYWNSLIDSPEPVIDTVETLLGRPALTFQAWAEEHADEFLPTSDE